MLNMFKDDTPICPYLNKACIKNKCMMWISIRGMNNNTGQECDEEGCSIAWMPLLMIDNTQRARETGAALESFRNEMVDLNKKTNTALTMAKVLDDRALSNKMIGSNT